MRLSVSITFFPGSKQYIEHLLAHPRFELIRHDVTFILYVEVDESNNLAAQRLRSITRMILRVLWLGKIEYKALVLGRWPV
jgi:hypothetical protein